MDDYTDFSNYSDLSYQIQDLSDGFWDQSITMDDFASQAWIDGDISAAYDYQVMSDNAEWSSNELYQASWDAYYGPVNAEGYTAYDASMGYSATDTSFIEPASSAGSTSMISDYSASSTL